MFALNNLSSTRRPRLLIRAARIGVAAYARERDLRRLLQSLRAPTPERALDRLVEIEESYEVCRRDGDAGYSVSRHVEVLSAIMAEARALAAGPVGAV